MPDMLLPVSYKLPLSGDVTQAINPWNWFFSPQASQFGIVNINVGRSADPGLEEQILDEVGSYGRQIGRIGDALEVLLKHVDLGALPAGDRVALDDFKLQVAQVRRLKLKRRRERAAGVVPAPAG
jgi:hypothetical protein